MEFIIFKQHSDDFYMVIESHALETYRSGPNHDVLALSAGGETYDVWKNKNRSHVIKHTKPLSNNVICKLEKNL